MLSQDELKTLVGQAALEYVVPGDIVGVGTGSTVNKFIDALGTMKNRIKGGGAALTREKIVAAQSRQFVCIADESKLVQTLGKFPLPVEVIPMATQRVIRQFAAMGGVGTVRIKNGTPLVTDNGQHIVDVTGLKITDPLAFETQVSQWPGVVTVGVFAYQRAQVCLLGTASGVKKLSL